MLLTSSKPKCYLTARQYGEVVLPDAASGQSPGTLACKLSRCKEGMAHFLPAGYKFYLALRVSRYKFDRRRETVTLQNYCWGHWRSVAVQIVSKPEIYHGTGFKLRTDERVRVQRPLAIGLECRGKSKKCDKQLTHIVRVSKSYYSFSLTISKIGFPVSFNLFARFSRQVFFSKNSGFEFLKSSLSMCFLIWNGSVNPIKYSLLSSVK